MSGAQMPSSDTPYFSTTRNMQYVERSVRDALSPFLGKISSPANTEYMQRVVQRSLDRLAASQHICMGSVSAAEDGKLNISLMLTPAAETVNMVLRFELENDATITDWPTGDNRIHVEL